MKILQGYQWILQGLQSIALCLTRCSGVAWPRQINPNILLLQTKWFTETKKWFDISYILIIIKIKKNCTFCSWLYFLSFQVQKIFYDINKDHRTFPFPLRSQVKLNCFSSNMKMEYKIINRNNFLTPNSIWWEAKFCKTIFYHNSLQITKTKRNFLLQNLLSHAQDNEVYVLKVTHNHVSPSAIKCWKVSWLCCKVHINFSSTTNFRLDQWFLFRI